jgi:hypothetical protein
MGNFYDNCMVYGIQFSENTVATRGKFFSKWGCKSKVASAQISLQLSMYVENVLLSEAQSVQWAVNSNRSMIKKTTQFQEQLCLSGYSRHFKI